MNNEENVIAGFFEGTVLENGYGYISREIMRDPNITKGAKVLYSYLLSFAGDKFSAFPTVSVVCYELGFGNQGTYYKYLNELKALGLLRTELVKNEKGKWDKNMFFLTRDKKDIEKIKKMNESIGKTGAEQHFKNRSTENGSTKKSSTNINSLNKNNLNTEEEEALQKLYDFYSSIKNKILSKYEKDEILKLSKEYNLEIILKGMEIMADKAEKINLGYLKKTLLDWKTKDLLTISQIEEHFVKHEIVKDDAKKYTQTMLERKAKGVGYGYVRKDTFNSYDQREYTPEKLEEIASATRGNTEDSCMTGEELLRHIKEQRNKKGEEVYE